MCVGWAESIQTCSPKGWDCINRCACCSKAPASRSPHLAGNTWSSLPSATPSSRHCRGLRDILPALEQRQQAPAADSWDALLEADDAAQLAAAVGRGRCMQLQCVHWLDVPFRLAEHCKAACPKVVLNPSAEEVARRRLPAACDPAVELDAPLLAGKAWERDGESGCLQVRGIVSVRQPWPCSMPWRFDG